MGLEFRGGGLLWGHPALGPGRYSSKPCPIRSSTPCAFLLRMWPDATALPSFPSLLGPGKEGRRPCPEVRMEDVMESLWGISGMRAMLGVQ